MLILLFALLALGAVFALVALTFGLVPAVLPSIAAFLVAYFVLSRQVAKKLEKLMLGAQAEMQKGRVDRGIALLEEVKRRYGRWQFFTTSALDGQIGSIYYLRKEFDRAKPYLERSFVRHWVAKAMLGVLLSRKKDYAQMDKVFEAAARYSGKQGLLWGVWAYLHHKAGRDDRALEILLRGQKKVGDADERLTANIMNLQNNKKLKMRGYGEQWYQFHLEMSPQMKEMRSRQVRYVQR